MNEQMITEGPVFAQPGWVCPVCGTVVSPYEKECPNCAKNKNVYNMKSGSNVSCTSDFENHNRQKDCEQMILS